MIEEIIHKLKELKGLLVEITDTVYSHHTRHELGGPDQINIDASQVVSGVFDLARIPDLPRGKITDFFSSPFWENIPDKPTTYPPEPHTHVRSEITDFFSAPFWENIPDKPSTYPPSPHTHVRSDITDFWNAPFWENIPDKPTAYPPEAHTHVRSDITDFFASPFWDNIPDKPFSTLGTEFTVVSGVLQIASVDWSKIANKPSEYPPEAHTHGRSDITDFWSTPFWDNIPDKPSAYPPEAHTHSRSDVTDFFSSPFWTNIPDKPFNTLGAEFTVSDGELQISSVDWSKVANKPSEYPPESHTHDYTDIILPTGTWSGLDADKLDGYDASAFAMASHTHSRSDITDFFASPFWDNIPDKPFSSVGGGLEVVSGVLKVKVDATTIDIDATNTWIYVKSITRDKVSDFFASPFWDNIPDKPSTFPPEAHTHSRSDITDFFSSPFWDNIPDKPFSTLGSEFTTSDGELQVASIDFSKITNRVSSLISFDSSLVPNADGNYDLGNSSYHWRDGWFSRNVYAGYYFTYDEAGNTFHLLSRAFGGTYTHLHILPNYSNPESKDTVIAFFGYNSKISLYDFRSLWSGSNVSMFSIDCANYLMKFRGTLRPYANNTYDIGDDIYRWRNGYFTGFLDVGSLRIGGTEVITSGRVLQNVTADASIITSGTLAWERIAENFPRYAEEVINSISLQGWMVFDGENDYAVIPHSDLLTPDEFTIVFIVRSHQRNQVLVMKDNPFPTNYKGFLVKTSPYYDAFEFLVGDGSTHDSIRTSDISFGEYHLVAFGFTSGQMKTWLDGLPDNSKDTDITSIAWTTADMYLAYWKPGSSACGPWDVACFLFYNRILSDEEIQQIYSDPTNPPTDGLVLWLDGSSIDYANRIWRDKRGNGNDATIYGAVPGGFPPKFHTHSSADVVYNSSMIPSSDNAYDIGTESLRWRNVCLGGIANFSNRAIISETAGHAIFGYGVYYDKEAGQYVRTLSGQYGVAIYARCGADNAVFELRKFDPDSTAYTSTLLFDMVNQNFKVRGNVLPYADGSYDLGNSSYHWRRLYLGGQLAGDTAISVDSDDKCNVIKMSVAGVDKGVICAYNVDGGDIQFRVNADVTNTLFDPNYPSWTIRVSGKYDAVDFLRKTSTTGYTYALRITSGDIVSYRTVKPASDNTYDIGDSSHYWRNIYYKGTLYGGSAEFSGDVNISTLQKFGLIYFEEAESKTIGSAGTVVDDPTASGGKAVKGTAGGSSGTIVFGPYRKNLRPGSYVVLYRLKVSDNTSTSSIARLDVNVNGVGLLASMYIRPTDFESANKWQIFVLPVELDKDVVEEYGGVELRVIEFNPNAGADLYVDWVALVLATVFLKMRGSRLDSNLIPALDGSYDLGKENLRWRNVYATNVYIHDGSNVRAGMFDVGMAYVGHDFRMARTVVGDFNWKRALVPYPHLLVVNFAGDFTDGVAFGGSLVRPHKDNATDFGDSSYRWKNGHFAGTVYANEFVGNSHLIIYPL